MNFEQLVYHIKKDGCIVRLYNKRKMKMTQCMGTFNISKNGNPVICIATRCASQLDKKRALLHEYAHYRQYVDGYINSCEKVINGWDVLDKWLSGKNYTEQELAMACNCIILIEYDAEIRTMQMSRSLGVDIGGEKDYCNAAHSYISSIKHAFMTRTWDNYQTLDLVYNKLYPKQAIKSLTIVEIKKLDA